VSRKLEAHPSSGDTLQVLSSPARKVRPFSSKVGQRKQLQPDLPKTKAIITATSHISNVEGSLKLKSTRRKTYKKKKRPIGSLGMLFNSTDFSSIYW